MAYSVIFTRKTPQGNFPPQILLKRHRLKFSDWNNESKVSSLAPLCQCRTFSHKQNSVPFVKAEKNFSENKTENPSKDALGKTDKRLD